MCREVKVMATSGNRARQIKHVDDRTILKSDVSSSWAPTSRFDKVVLVQFSQISLWHCADFPLTALTAGGMTGRTGGAWLKLKREDWKETRSVVWNEETKTIRSSNSDRQCVISLQTFKLRLGFCFLGLLWNCRVWMSRWELTLYTLNTK